MQFDVEQAVDVLSRTPQVLSSMLRDLPPGWIKSNEGPDTWSPFDIVGHLIHGERTDWIPRARMILDQGETRTFPPFDRFAQLTENQGKDLGELLDTFAALRAQALEALGAMRLGPEELARSGRHPDFGRVTLGELLATWVVHDLSHIRQVARVMARQYASEVGPWRAYLPVLNSG